MPYPNGLPKRYRKHWNRPWTVAAKWSPGFRRWLKHHGYLSPHFKTKDAHSKDGTKIPRHLAAGARNHAFHLERVRHALGDRPMPVLSWYRSPAHNRAVGGASQSKHMSAIATDHPKSWVDRVGGQSAVERAARQARGIKGFGRYPGGSAHLDSRYGPFTVWSSW